MVETLREEVVEEILWVAAAENLQRVVEEAKRVDKDFSYVSPVRSLVSDQAFTFNDSVKFHSIW